MRIVRKRRELALGVLGLLIAGGGAVLVVARWPAHQGPSVAAAVSGAAGAARQEITPLLKTLDLITPSRVQAAKEFSVRTPDGLALHLSDYRGKVVFVNFWATWCPPCAEEMPAMDRLYRRNRDNGLVVLAVSVDAQGAPIVLPFVRARRFSYPIGLDPTMTLAEQYGVRALPTSFLIDKKGALVAMALGPRQWDGQAAQALIESLLR